jgi:hypothetical protein
MLTAFIFSAMTSETSVDFYQTTRGNIPEDSHLDARFHENLKSQNYGLLFEDCHFNVTYKEEAEHWDVA